MKISYNTGVVTFHSLRIFSHQQQLMSLLEETITHRSVSFTELNPIAELVIERSVRAAIEIMTMIMIFFGECGIC